MLPRRVFVVQHHRVDAQLDVAPVLAVVTARMLVTAAEGDPYEAVLLLTKFMDNLAMTMNGMLAEFSEETLQ